MSRLNTVDVARLIEVMRRAAEDISNLEARATAMPVNDPAEIRRDVLATLGVIKAAQTETIDLRPIPPLTDPEPLPPGAGEIILSATSLEERATRVFDLCGHAQGHTRSVPHS